jgi:hypothetical protein
MDGKKATMRDRWLERAEAAYRRMFEGKNQGSLVTLAQRETMAGSIAKELAGFLLEQHVAQDPAAQPDDASSTCCPKCGEAGMLADPEDEKLPDRTVTTLVGDISLRRQRWHCAKCRIIFFRWTFDWVWGRRAIARRSWEKQFVRRARLRRLWRRAMT